MPGTCPHCPYGNEPTVCIVLTQQMAGGPGHVKFCRQCDPADPEYHAGAPAAVRTATEGLDWPTPAPIVSDALPDPGPCEFRGPIIEPGCGCWALSLCNLYTRLVNKKECIDCLAGTPPATQGGV